MSIGFLSSKARSISEFDLKSPHARDPYNQIVQSGKIALHKAIILF